AADTKLCSIKEELARREAATKRLREILLKPWPNASASDETLEERISSLSDAVSTGTECRVPQGDLEAAEEALQVLQGLHRREQAQRALTQALDLQDLQAAKRAYTHAKECGVSEEELVSFEHQMRDLSDALELADDKERLMERRVAAAVEAKSQAERMESSAEVEKMLGEGGVIAVLRDAIQEAKKARLVKKGAIARAEAVVPETIADLKRIIADKQLAEKRTAEEHLRGEVELVREAGILHVGVLEGLRNAIAEATRFSADVRDAEQVLAQLTKELEKLTLETKEALSQAFAARIPADIRKGISACRQLLLNEEHAGAMTQLRGITEEDIASARSEHDREARMARVAILEQFVGILRENGDKQLRAFHNDLQDLKGALRVFCRVRPLNGREIKKNDTIAVEIVDAFTVAVNKSETDKQAGPWSNSE
ncbi:KIN14I, partial [Symbiodinium pilosum]